MTSSTGSTTATRGSLAAMGQHLDVAVQLQVIDVKVRPFTTCQVNGQEFRQLFSQHLISSLAATMRLMMHLSILTAVDSVSFTKCRGTLVNLGGGVDALEVDAEPAFEGGTW